MKKAYIFVLGGTSTITLSIFLFILVPRLQIAEIDKKALSVQAPYTEEELFGRKAYIEYGCVYCHSQQVRDPIAGADKAFGWGRASHPSDYIHDNPQLTGTMRTGPDLSNIGSRQPSKTWHHLHLYNPRLLVEWSIMPSFPFLYKKVMSIEKPTEGAYQIPGKDDQWILPTRKAESLVLYMLSLKRDQPVPVNQGEDH